MTMILKKDFISFNYRLFVLPAFTRAFFIKSSPYGELSYNTKKVLSSDRTPCTLCTLKTEHILLLSKHLYPNPMDKPSTD